MTRPLIHYFVVQAEIVEGQAVLSMSNETAYDPNKPVWDPNSEEWLMLTERPGLEDSDTMLAKLVQRTIEALVLPLSGKETA